VKSEREISDCRGFEYLNVIVISVINTVSEDLGEFGRARGNNGVC
jgi:hypothetical protein